jgi:hypothetical protein
MIATVKERCFQLGLLGLLAFLSMGAKKERPLLAILILSSSEIDVSNSDVYAASRREIEKNTVFRVASFDVFSASLKAETVRECAGNGACFATKLHQSGSNADWLMTVALDRLGEDLALGLRLIKIGAALNGGDGERVLSKVLPNSASPLRGLTDLLPRLFQDEQWGQLATLSVEVAQADAVVIVRDRTCISPCQFQRLRAGTHRVTIQKPGYVTISKSIDLRPRADEKLRFSLQPDSSNDADSSLLLWGGIGLGIAAALVGTWVVIDAADRPIDVCIAADPAQCGL